VKPRYLVDTSALLRLVQQPVAAVLEPLLLDGAVAISIPVLLESLYSARASDYLRVKTTYEAATSILPLTPEVSFRAVEVQAILARQSQHRTAQASDLLTAACAELNHLTILHYDKEYDAIADVTGQPAMWVVPAGTVA
jgi:predicted nucleic acid-binding protein